jgi:hypothetical protein
MSVCLTFRSDLSSTTKPMTMVVVYLVIHRAQAKLELLFNETVSDHNVYVSDKTWPSQALPRKCIMGGAKTLSIMTFDIMTLSTRDIIMLCWLLHLYFFSLVSLYWGSCFSIAMLSVVVPSVAHFYCYAECCSAECCCAECRGASYVMPMQLWSKFFFENIFFILDPESFKISKIKMKILHFRYCWYYSIHVHFHLSYACYIFLECTFNNVKQYFN